MLVQPASYTKWLPNLFYGQEWQVSMNCYKVNETGYLPNMTLAIANYSARAIFSSTVRYIMLPGNL